MVSDVLVVPMTMTTMVVLMDTILSDLIDSIIEVRWGGVESQYHYPLTFCHEIFGALAKVINLRVRNKRRKEVGGIVYVGGDRYGSRGNRGVDDDLEVLMTMTTKALLISLILSALVDLLRGLRGVGVESHYQCPLTHCYEYLMFRPNSSTGLLEIGAINYKEA